MWCWRQNPSQEARVQLPGLPWVVTRGKGPGCLAPEERQRAEVRWKPPGGPWGRCAWRGWDTRVQALCWCPDHLRKWPFLCGWLEAPRAQGPGVQPRGQRTCPSVGLCPPQPHGGGTRELCLGLRLFIGVPGIKEFMLQKGGHEVKVRAHTPLAAVLRTWNKWAIGQQRGRPRGCPGVRGSKAWSKLLAAV